MSDDANTQESGVETTTTIPENVEQVDRAELEKLRAADERMRRLEEEIGSEFTSVEEYVQELEREVANKQSSPETPKAQTAPKQPTGQQGPSPELMQSVAQAQVHSHWVEYRMDQNELPADHRAGYKKEDLLKVLYNEASLVGDVAKRSSGNYFEAAKIILDTRQGSVAQKIAQGKREVENTEAAKAAAAASATLPTGGATSPPKEMTAEERQSAAKKAELDRLLPDDPRPAFE